MIYDLLLAAPGAAPEALRAALAVATGAAEADVDLADVDADPSGDHRDWDAPVLCGYSRLRGDLALSLDVFVRDDAVPAVPAEPELARRLAAATGAAALYTGPDDAPSSYWRASPDGTTAHVHVDPSDDDPPRYTVTPAP
ncbi:hypothetical protein [Streptomyces sp. NPDC060194]|uniref:hypothetical protein n=1 Tax=Streptomyces sp. NPDC060194 TaxID=3347069 RepID=UPI003663223C